MNPAARRAGQLQALFEQIATTRMAGVPICHPGLVVRAIGFEPLPEEPGTALGVLLTPWFMSLVRLPLDPTLPPVLAERASAVRTVGAHRFAFLGSFEPTLGPFEACSLFSPMDEFADQAAAEATAREVLALLRSDAAPAPSPVPVAAAAQADPPSRRGFLFGRRGPQTGAPRLDPA